MIRRYQQTLFLILAVLASSLLTGMVFTRSAGEASAAGEREPLVLTPKSQLKVEQGAWTFAPNVPPAIRRKEQRRVVVNWEVRETAAEIAPGVVYEDYWGFEGRVPGPLLRVREGDLVEFHLKNGMLSKNPHNVDFHFVLGPGGGAMATDVLPGETATLEARAMAPGFYMFHCATPDIPTHISNGMYGFVIVEPKEGLPEVDKEFYVVQSEFYTQAGSEDGRLQFDLERGSKFDAEYVVFNGAVGSMMGEKAVRAHVTDRIRLWVGNAGPNLISSFHVIGQVFDKVYREGDLLSPPARGIQTTTIPAGGSAIVEFTPQVPGNFLLVDHAIFRLHQGAVGAINVSGPEAAEIFEPITAKHAAMSGDGHSAHKPIPREAKGAEREPKPEQPKKETSKNAVTVDILAGAGNYDKNFSNDYSQPKLRVKAGTTVTWVNRDTMVHNVESSAGGFQSKLMKPFESWSYTFKEKGTFPYICGPHPWMKGTVIAE